MRLGPKIQAVPRPVDVTPLAVAAGVISDAGGAVLLGERPAPRSLAGWWEFPGGKIEAGETPHQALGRELDEELGITLRASRPLMTFDATGLRPVRIHLREVLAHDGTPAGREGQKLAWVERAALAAWPLLPADRPALAALTLPHRYAITPPEPYSAAGIAALGSLLRRPLERGGMMLQIRLPDWPPEALRALLAPLRRPLETAGVPWLLNADPDTALALGASGVHLSAARLKAADRDELDRARAARSGWIIAASCHNAAELARAAECGVDFVCLGPVRKTPSHPGRQPLGWDGLAALAIGAPLPVYALGGVGPGDFDQARDAGAAGIAGIRGLW